MISINEEISFSGDNNNDREQQRFGRDRERKTSRMGGRERRKRG